MLNRKTRGLTAVRELMRRSCTSWVCDSAISASPVDIKVNPLVSFSDSPGIKQVTGYLGWASATGQFTVSDLDYCLELMQRNSLNRKSELNLHLASLYLQLEEHETVLQLLADTDPGSEEMCWFAALMLFARANGYPLPVTGNTELASLDYLEKKLTDASTLVEGTIKNGCLTVVGNAPGQPIDLDNSLQQLVYFNDYQKNPRLQGDPHIHVVTPSWNISGSTGGRHLMITGNSIFHRRSRVWRKFSHCPDYQSIACFPRELWARLYSELNAPPSAGLLMICFIAEYAKNNSLQISAHGFSKGKPQVNHDFDRVPASTRHNWDQETLLRESALAEILRLQAS